jgi:membrane fusion protein (multidrug efflux system)
MPPDDDARSTCRPRPVRRLPWLVAAALATSLPGCGSSSDAESGAKLGAAAPPEAGYVVLRAQDVPLTVELAGRTTPFEVSEVRPQVTGVIQARLFEEGSLVRAGQTLYRIDPSRYRAAVAEARAGVRSAVATRNAAQARAARLRALLEDAVVSRQDYVDAQATADEAAAAVAMREAALSTTNIALRQTAVPAPIAGRIGRSLVTTGALVTESQAAPMATIQRLDPIYVDMQQSSAELLALRRALAAGGVAPVAAQVELTLEDGARYPTNGELQFAESMVDENTGTVTLRARVANPDGLLLPGMYVRARIAQSQVRDAVLAPQQGISRNAKGQATALVVGADGRAEPRTVVAPRTVGDQWLITAGLHPGDRLIVEGLARIEAGTPVRPVPATDPGLQPSLAASAGRADAATPTSPEPAREPPRGARGAAD